MRRFSGIALYLIVFAAQAARGGTLAALDIDAGIGLDFGYNYTGLTLVSRPEGEYKQGYGVGGVGQFLFVDATYVEGSINFFFASTSLKYNETLKSYKGFAGDYNLSGVYIGLGLLLKYPFYVGKVTFFPLAGFETNLYISQSYSKDYDEFADTKEGNAFGKPYYWNAFWFRVGAGADYQLTEHIFFRGELLMDIKLPSGLDTEYMKNTEFTNAPEDFSDPQFFGLGVSFRLSFGIKVSNLLGYPSKPRTPAAPKPSTKKPAPEKPPKRKPGDFYPPEGGY
jgi:hypothetical protein